LSEPPKPPDSQVPPELPKPKALLPNYVVPGRRDGKDVLRILGPPNSYVRGGKDNVFELDDRGLVARQFSPERVKLREQHTNPKTGQVHEKWSEKVAVSKADLDILRKMGVIK
jgi:hypothetical protein